MPPWSSPDPTVEARIVRVLDIEGDPDLLSSWSSLHERALEQNPFFEPQCVLPAARHLPDGERIELLMAVEEITVHGCMPLCSLPRWHWSPRGAVTTKVRRLTWLGTPLLDRDRAAEAMTAMLALLRGRRRSSGDHLLAIEWMHTAGPVAEVLRHAASGLGLPVATGERFERPALIYSADPDRPGDPPAPVRRRKTTRNLRNRLDREVGPVETVDRSGEAGAVEDFIQLESRGYNGRQGIALAGQPGEAESLRAMCQAFGADDRLVVTCLEAAGRTIASNVMVTAGDEVFGCLIAYDEEYAAYSPGIQLYYDSIDLLGRADFRQIDTCTYAGNTALADIFPGRIEVGTLLVGLGSSVERTLLRAIPLARRWRAAVRSRVASRS